MSTKSGIEQMNAPKVKRRVGKYEVGRTIGEGTFAKVKFARNSETGEPVALKILDREKVLKHKMVEQVRFLIRKANFMMMILLFGGYSLQMYKSVVFIGAFLVCFFDKN